MAFWKDLKLFNIIIPQIKHKFSHLNQDTNFNCENSDKKHFWCFMYVLLIKYEV